MRHADYSDKQEGIMWISRQAYQDGREALLKATASAEAIDRQNSVLTTHLEWLRVRLTQLEFERAQLIQKYMGITMPVPQFDTTPTPDAIDPNQTMDFNDVGDDYAHKLGLSWNSDGTLNYNGKQ
jgi:hypothetical protein